MNWLVLRPQSSPDKHIVNLRVGEAGFTYSHSRRLSLSMMVLELSLFTRVAE